MRIPLTQYTLQLQKGANDARSDNVRRVKEEVASWINQTHSSTAPLSMKQRDDCGLQNDVTGHLLCPIEFSWDDDEYATTIIDVCRLNKHCFCSVHRKIQTVELDISEDYFLICLYPQGVGNPDNVERGFLRSGLLVKVAVFPSIDYLCTDHQTFCALFTSPSSSEAFDEQDSEEGPSRKKMKMASQKKATKTNVATLLRMDGKVTPRAIAYASTLLCSFNSKSEVL